MTNRFPDMSLNWNSVCRCKHMIDHLKPKPVIDYGHTDIRSDKQRSQKSSLVAQGVNRKSFWFHRSPIRSGHHTVRSLRYVVPAIAFIPTKQLYRDYKPLISRYQPFERRVSNAL